MNGNINGFGNRGFSSLELEYIRRHHRHEPGENQCGSALVKHIKAPVHLVSNQFNLISVQYLFFVFISLVVVVAYLHALL